MLGGWMTQMLHLRMMSYLRIHPQPSTVVELLLMLGGWVTQQRQQLLVDLPLTIGG